MEYAGNNQREKRAVCQYCGTQITMPEPLIERIPTPVPQYAPYPPAAPNDTLAKTSAIVATLGLLFIPLVGPPAGLVMGIKALQDIRKQPQRFGGERFAWIGIILGGIGTVMTVLVICFYVLLFLVTVFSSLNQ